MKEFVNKSTRKIAVNGIYVFFFLAVLYFLYILPPKEIVMIELVTELLFLVVCFFIFYSFSKLNVLSIKFGWAMFCFGLALDVLDEVAQTEGVIHKNAEDVISMLGITVVAYGFQKASKRLQRLLNTANNASIQFESMAHTDKLTGLPNRTRFSAELSIASNAADTLNTRIAVLFIDLNKFKPINDKYGHDGGDMLLKAVGERIKSSTRQSDLLCRWGGDEFLIIQTGFEDVQAPVDLSNRILRSLELPFNIHDNHIELGAAIGYAIYPDDAENTVDLVKRADIAMYNAKNSGANLFRFDSSLL